MTGRDPFKSLGLEESPLEGITSTTRVGESRCITHSFGYLLPREPWLYARIPLLPRVPSKDDAIFSVVVHQMITVTFHISKHFYLTGTLVSEIFMYDDPCSLCQFERLTSLA